MALLNGSIFFLALVVSAAAQAYVAFDSASASSVYAAGSFTAEQAIAPGSGYWCRSACLGCRPGMCAIATCASCVQLWAAWSVRVMDRISGLALQSGGREDQLARSRCF